jgi:hypothetical protein
MAPKRAYVPGDRRAFPDVTAPLLAMVALDAVLVAGGWVAGPPTRAGLVLLGIDLAWRLGWLLVRRWWRASPY